VGAIFLGQLVRTAATDSCAAHGCDLSAASRPSAERWTCGPVRKRGASFTPAHQTEQDIARRRFSSVIGCAAFGFTKPDATQAAKRSATASPSSYREAATPNGDPAGRLGDGIVRPAFVAHLATRGCDKEARVAPAIRGANFNAAERHGATNQIQRIPVGQLSGSANAAHSDRQRPARFAAVPCRLPRPFSSL